MLMGNHRSYVDAIFPSGVPVVYVARLRPNLGPSSAGVPTCSAPFGYRKSKDSRRATRQTVMRVYKKVPASSSSQKGPPTRARFA